MYIQSNVTNTQSGNILIYILGAIVLIGLLTVMVKGSTTPGSGIDREALTIRVAEVQAYGNELERAVAYVLRNGYSETDIRFAHPNHDSTYGDITDDPARQIFAREGGGATWRDNETDIQDVDTDWVFNARNVVNGVGSTGITHGNVDLILLLMNVTEKFCLLINDKNDLENPSGVPPQDNSTLEYITLFVGDYSRVNHISATPTNYFEGKMEGCFEGGTTPPAGTYHYYRVLLAR